MTQKTGLVPRSQVDEIIQSTDIIALLGGYLSLKPSGKNFQALCPFHFEKTPSFVVSPSRNNYHCYGCGAHGDAIRFVMEQERFSFIEALQFLADRCGIILDKQGNNQNPVVETNENQDCIQKTFDFFRQNLKKAEEGSLIKTYLQQRQIGPDCIEQFQLGFAEPGWKNLYQHLLDCSFGQKIQDHLGLIKTDEKGNVYDRLRKRLIFPIRETTGRIIGFSGRSLEKEDRPKYLNPPETELYKKSSVLYGMYEANQAIRKKQRMILVEGYLDVIRMHEQGWQETVASCGTAVNEGHIGVIKRNQVKEVILLFDGDQAGITAAKKTAQLFLENNLDSRVVVLPEGMDPDDYFNTHTKEDFQRLLDNSRYDYDFLIHQLHNDIAGKGIETQRIAINDLLVLNKNINSAVKRELLIDQISKQFNIAKNLISSNEPQTTRWQTTNKPEQTTIRPEQKLIHLEDSPKTRQEAKFIQYLIAQPKSIDLARKKITDRDFENQKLAQLYARFLQLNNQEFTALKPRDFPEQFVEYSSLINSLMHQTNEYSVDAYSEPKLNQVIQKFQRLAEQKRLQQHKNEDPDKQRAFLLKRQQSRLKQTQKG